MKNDEESLNLIKNKFHRQEKRIDLLFRENEDFRVLCSDYYSCMQSLKKLKKSINEIKGGLTDFKTALKDLEAELYYFIS